MTDDAETARSIDWLAGYQEGSDDATPRVCKFCGHDTTGLPPAPSPARPSGLLREAAEEVVRVASLKPSQGGSHVNLQTALLALRAALAATGDSGGRSMADPERWSLLDD